MIPEWVYPIFTLIFGFFIGYRFRKYMEEDEKIEKEMEQVKKEIEYGVYDD